MIMAINEIRKEIRIIDVTRDNIAEMGIFCIKDKKAPGFKQKVKWFSHKLNKGLRMKIATDVLGNQLGFIEYIPSELAWRPIKADNYFFIQCIALFVKDAKHKGLGTRLIQICEEEAKQENKSGVCVMCSNGPWMVSKTIFEKCSYAMSDQHGRYELMVKKFKKINQNPTFIDWTKRQASYKGWNLIYSDQCPWHEKSVTVLKKSALDSGIDLKVMKLNTPKEVQNGPSGFGTFGLIKDGKLLEDHVCSLGILL